MSGAFDFLTAACRVWLGTGPAGLAVGPGSAVDELEELAFVHNLEPMLFRLDESGALDRTTVPSALRGRWEKAYYQNLVFNTEALELLARLEDGWGRAGLSTAVFKGPASLARGYSDPGLRPMVDLDVLCRESELAALVRVARGCGFGDAEEDSVYHLSLTHAESALGLELHFDLYDFLPRRRELRERLLAGAVEVELSGCRFRAVETAPALLLDVAHLVSHDFRAGLKPLLDLAAGVRRTGSPPAADAVAAEAERFGLEPELELAGALVAKLFAVRLPGAGGDPRPDAADLDRIGAALERPTADQPALEGASARPGWAGKAAYLARLLFPPAGRLAAAAPESEGGVLALRRWHLAARLRSALRRRRSWGTAADAAAESSVRRRVYERRGR